jgi:putative transposase
MCTHKAFQFRINPNEEQKIFFAKSFGCVRLVYNLMLDAQISPFDPVGQGAGAK